MKSLRLSDVHINPDTITHFGFNPAIKVSRQPNAMHVPGAEG